MICDNISVRENRLFFAGMDTVKLAGQYGTPLYLFDENKIREKCRIYTSAFKKHFPEGSLPIYASKAACFKYIYKIILEEGLGTDVVSSGEIYTAASASFDMSKAFFQGNNKTDEDIEFAIDNGIGFFVADNKEELVSINSISGRKGLKSKVLLRLTPGIDTHTFAACKTGNVDSKFGCAIETGQAYDLVKFTLDLENIDLRGFHCHIGSQIFDEDVFERASEIMLEFMAKVKEELKFECEYLDLGGGYGVRYVESDPVLDIGKKISEVAAAIDECCKKLSLTFPKIIMEPGRSIVADAGMTLYTAGTVKQIPGYKNYVSINGSMTDNPRYCLYKAKYTCIDASKAEEKCDFKCSLVGRCCEEGDRIQDDIFLPSSVSRGDIIAVCTTGAYNYSMASNYNRLPRPPIVMIKDGESFTVVKREQLSDLIEHDM